MRFSPFQIVSSALFAAALVPGYLCAAPAAAAQAPEFRHPPPRSRMAPPLSAIVPDVIFFNGVIYTGVGMERDQPETVQAMAIGGGKVLAVGSNEEITRLAGPNTRLDDLDTAKSGAFIFPGFNDAHTHLGMAARTKLNVDLTGATSLGNMLAKVQTFANAAPAGQLAHRRQLGPHALG